jgi:hypothetical protein
MAAFYSNLSLTKVGNSSSTIEVELSSESKCSSYPEIILPSELLLGKSDLDLE